MSRPARMLMALAGLGLVLAVMFGAWHTWRDQVSASLDISDATSDEQVLPQVEVESIRHGSITEQITAYGSVIPAPGAVQAISVAFESQVQRIMVSAGQQLRMGDALLQIEPSPETLLRLETARSERDLTLELLHNVESRLTRKLATNDQVLKARLNYGQADLRLQAMERQGITPGRVLHAPIDGMVSAVHVQEGTLVSGGTPFLDLIVQNRLEVHLGVEVEDIDRVQPTQPIQLTHVNAPALGEVTARIREMSRAVNPATRMVDIFVTFPASATFLLGEFVVGNIPVVDSEGLVVPRAAVVTRDGRHSLFTVENGRAVSHPVLVGLENKTLVQISGEGIEAGMQAVTLGSYEIEEGMAVQIKTSR